MNTNSFAEQIQAQTKIIPFYSSVGIEKTIIQMDIISDDTTTSFG